jgi:tryptophan synthase beta chain
VLDACRAATGWDPNPAYAVAECIKRAHKMNSSDVVIVNISGRGDKDVGTLRENLAR